MKSYHGGGWDSIKGVSSYAWKALKLGSFFGGGAKVWDGSCLVVGSCGIRPEGVRAQVERGAKVSKAGRNIFKKFGRNGAEVEERLGVVKTGGGNIYAYIPQL